MLSIRHLHAQHNIVQYSAMWMTDWLIFCPLSRLLNLPTLSRLLSGWIWTASHYLHTPGCWRSWSRAWLGLHQAVGEELGKVRIYHGIPCHAMQHITDLKLHSIEYSNSSYSCLLRWVMPDTDILSWYNLPSMPSSFFPLLLLSSFLSLPFYALSRPISRTSLSSPITSL